MMERKAKVQSTIDIVSQRKEYAVSLRRWFHEHPEPSFQEVETSARIRLELDNLGIEYQQVGKTGTVGVIHGDGNGPVIGLRADIDALEIQEENEVTFRSQTPGMMHACGHDSHMAALLTAARILSEYRSAWNGTVKLIFQPAEELGDGAVTIAESGLIDDVDAFFGIHVNPGLKTGQVSVARGGIMAGANSLHIVIKGQRGHAALPHETKDAVVAGCAVVSALQHIVARETNPVSPAVVSVGMFHAGTRGNIIADRAEITGTVRVITEEDRTRIADAVRRIVSNVAAAYGVEAEINCNYSTGIVINSDELYQTAFDAAGSVVGKSGVVQLPVIMTADDFYVYRKIAPAFYTLVGVNGDSSGAPTFPLHSGRFTLDENALPIETALHVEFVRQFRQC